MRERWQRALTRMDQEAPRIKQEAQGSTPQVGQQAEQVRREVPASTTEELGAKPRTSEPYQR
jgi:hypothetical protein